MTQSLPRLLTIEKAIGETPLQAAERLRIEHNIPADIPLAYAGRLDPMASGQLLILVGDECKRQTEYHALDKEYEFEVLLGVASDTADVLGLLTTTEAKQVTKDELKSATKKLIGEIELPYPHFSSKTVQGKPLHIWTLENRLDEITIPTKRSCIHRLSIQDLRTITKDEVYETVTTKIETIPPVTEASKALGNDFRRPDVRTSWQHFQATDTRNKFQIATFKCVASSGTYMRTLAEVIARKCGTVGLAYSIHRTNLGQYKKLFGPLGFWIKRY